MPNPNSSGTGFLDVSSWLQMFGEDGGWAFMDSLHKNISHYTHSGSKPCKQAARGEVAIGVSFAFRGAKSKAKGAPLVIVVPSEGIGWDMEATAIVKGTKKLAAAKTLVDWSITEDANKMYNEGYAVIAIPALAKPAMARSSVVLPQPEGPRKQTNSPSWISSEMSSSAVNEPNFLLRCSILR